MDYKIIPSPHRIALVSQVDQPIDSEQAALDFFLGLSYGENVQHFVLGKDCFPPSFYDLKTGLAGAILQKIVNYRLRLAIVGDFSGYTSQALQDFIYECKKGRHIAFLATEQEALAFLKRN